jgi:hypothetical protein
MYLIGRNLFALVWLLARRRRSKELEILLRHELAVLRWHAGRPSLTRADRTLFALSRAAPRTAWANLAVKLDTLLRGAPPACRAPLDVRASECGGARQSNARSVS